MATPERRMANGEWRMEPGSGCAGETRWTRWTRWTGCWRGAQRWVRSAESAPDRCWGRSAESAPDRCWGRSPDRAPRALLTIGVLTVAFLAIGARGQQDEPLPKPVAASLESVSAAGIRAHVRYLADDLLEGRDTGTRGNSLAAAYIASQFEHSGVAPAANGSYLQPVAFAWHSQDVEASSLRITAGEKSETLKLGADFLPVGFGATGAQFEGGLVFAGYGISAPEFKHDDYKALEAQNVSLKGKMVVAFAGEPPSKDPAIFDGERATRYSQLTTKLNQALERGAAGLVGIITEGAAPTFQWEQFRSRLSGRRMGLEGQAPAFGRRAAPGAPAPAFPLLAVTADAAGRLLTGAPAGYADLEAAAATNGLKPFALPSTAALKLAVKSEPFKAPNVAGLVEGSDPNLRRQVVIYTAHYDHVGSRQAPEGQDGIFNGAWDNASGTAGVLETARAFARLSPGERPRRSLLFLLVTGEEHGLLGSAYYTQKPLFPLAETAANINLDMTEIFGIPRDFCPLGAEFSSLKTVAEKVARQLKMKVGPDPTPELRTFVRSDQFSFVREGVPAIFLRWGNEYEDLPPDQVKAAHKHKLDTIYHKAADGFDPAWSWEGMRRHTQIAFLLGYHIANEAAMPAWDAGSPYNKPRTGTATP